MGGWGTCSRDRVERRASGWGGGMAGGMLLAGFLVSGFLAKVSRMAENFPDEENPVKMLVI